MDQYAPPDGYPGPDIHAGTNLHQIASAKPDAAPNRYALGHLDSEPDADRYANPHSHPASFAKLHSLPNLDAESERYSLAGPNAHQYQIKNARNHYRSQPCL